MGTPRGKGQRAGAKSSDAKDEERVKLTLRMTRAERRKIRTFAADKELTVSQLVLRLTAGPMEGWFTVQRGKLPRLAPGTDAPSAAGGVLPATEVRAAV
jgi:hypothetical protein